MNFGRRPSRVEAVERLLEHVDAHAVGVHLDLHDVGLVGAERRHGARVGRRLGDDDVARVDQRLADEVDDLLAAGRDEDVLGVDVVPSAAMTVGDRVLDRRQALGRARTAARAAHDRRRPAGP